jgi:hypothetical protein
MNQIRQRGGIAKNTAEIIVSDRDIQKILIDSIRENPGKEIELNLIGKHPSSEILTGLLETIISKIKMNFKNAQLNLDKFETANVCIRYTEEDKEGFEIINKKAIPLIYKNANLEVFVTLEFWGKQAIGRSKGVLTIEKVKKR